jgi:hypothetical protein
MLMLAAIVLDDIKESAPTSGVFTVIVHKMGLGKIL